MKGNRLWAAFAALFFALLVSWDTRPVFAEQPPQVAYGWGYGDNSFTAYQSTNGREAAYFSTSTSRSPINIQSLDQGIPSTLSGTRGATGSPSETWTYPDIRNGQVKLVLSQPSVRNLVPSTIERKTLSNSLYGIIGPTYDSMSWFEAKPESDGLHVRMDIHGTATQPSDRMVDIVVPKGRALELHMTRIIPSSGTELFTVTIWHDTEDWVWAYGAVTFNEYPALWANHMRNIVVVHMANRMTSVVVAE